MRKEKGTIEITEFDGNEADSQLLQVLSCLQWMTEGLPEDLTSREPCPVSTLDHIAEEIE